MKNGTVRVDVALPRGLLDAIELVGQRQRTQYVEEAIAEKLLRDRQDKAIASLLNSGSVLISEDHPERQTPEKTSNWVPAIRHDADRSAMRKVRRS